MKSTRMLPFIAAVVAMEKLWGADWPQFLGPNGDGTSPETIRTNWSEVAPREIWRKSIGPGFSSIAAVGDRLFTLVRRLKGNQDREYCVKLDASTGDEFWGVDIDAANYDNLVGYEDAMDGPRSTPTVDGDFVYVYTSRLKLLCLRSEDGAVVWKRDFIAELGGALIPWQNAASPLLVGDLLFVNASAGQQSLMAVRKQDGSTVWTLPNFRATHSTPVFARIHETPQVIFLTRSGLLAVAPETGSILWQLGFQPNSTSVASSPVVSENHVFATAAYASGAWMATIGSTGSGFGARLAWRQQGNLFQSHWSTPVADDGFLYSIPSPSSSQSRLTCLEVQTGANRWTQSTVGSRGIGFGSLIKCRNALIVLTEAGELVLVEANPTAYRELARRSVLELYCWNHVTLANGRLYARSTSLNPQLVSLDLTAPSAPLPTLKLSAGRGATADSMNLNLGAADGTALDASQLGRVELLWTTNLLLPLTQWAPHQAAFKLQNGAGSASIQHSLGPLLFLRARAK